MDSKEPYRATRLWNEVIEAFQNGMPLKKHRWRMQSYNHCFTASEAITWLHCYLMNNSNFGANVTRQQTVNLLQKFLKCHVIESVVVRSKKKELADDSHLYRLSPVSQISKPSALCLIQSPAFGMKHKNNKIKKSSEAVSEKLQKENIPECHFVEKKLTVNEINLVWKKVMLSRLERLFPNFLNTFDEKDIDGFNIKHNSTRLSKTGVVVLTDKTDDIPYWVISAMKCLVNWPNASGSGSCLPNYPGFEKDVFKVVRDFFINTQVPLIPELFSNALLKVFCHFTKHEYIDLNNVKSASVLTLNNSVKSSVPKCSNIKTSTPLGANESLNNSSNNTIRSNTGTAQAKLLLDDPNVMWDYPSTVFYETDFGTSNPVTRIISDQTSQTSRAQSLASSVESINSMSTISVCSQNYRQGSLGDSISIYNSPLKSWKSNLYLQDEVKEPFSWHTNPLYFSPHYKTDLISSVDACSLNRTPLVKAENSDKNVYLGENDDLDTSNLSDQTVVNEDEKVEEQMKRYGKEGLYYSPSNLNSKYSSSSQINKISQTSLTLKEQDYPEKLKLSFQLILLLLPSPSRRQLHLLSRLINKVLKNGKFVLNVKTSMRHYLLETFLPAIVSSGQSSFMLLEFVAFLVDYCEDLFQIPLGFSQEVEECSRSCFGRIRYVVDDPSSLTYCELVSKQKYEAQRVTGSQEALRSLLNSIVVNGDLSDREKKRKIKQFKEKHPEIYYMQFSEKPSNHVKSKQTLLNRLAHLRL